MERAKKKKLIVLASVAAGLVVLLLLMMWVRTLSPAFSEFMCRYVSRPWVYVVGHITSLFPFSVYELILILVIVAAVELIVTFFVSLAKKRFYAVLKGLTVIVICILSVFNLYTLLVGFCYYRPEAPIPMSEKEYTSAEVTEMVRYFADDFNALSQKMQRDQNGDVIRPYTLSQMSDRLVEEYKRLDDDYYYSYTPRAVGVTNSWFLTLNNLTGLTFVPLGEPTVNKDTPPSDIPATMAHEMAHAKGVIREGEANFVSYYILLTSEDEYLRYCGYFSVFYSLLPAVNADSSIKKDQSEIRNNVDQGIRKELTNSYRFWTEKSQQPGAAGFFNRTFEKIGTFMNDIFLKSNGAENGNDSYNDKVTDSTVTDTGERNPIPGTDQVEIIYEVTYSSVQKMFFAIYEDLRGNA